MAAYKMRISDLSSDVGSSDLLRRKRETGQIELRRAKFGWRHADKNGQHITGFGKLLAKLGEFAPIIGKLGLRIQHFGQRAFARAPSRFREVDIMLILGDQCVGGCDAGANPRDRQHLIDYASGDGEMRCLCLIALRFRLSADLLKFAARAAEQVEIVGNAAADSIEVRSEEHTSELQSLMRISYAVFCL